MTPGDDHDRVPLAVDLDGTLVLGDTLHESLLALLRRNPLLLLAMPLWLLRGKAAFKRELARRVLPDPARLAWNLPFLEWLRGQRGRREIVLCTAADAGIAQAVADHAGVFDAVMASDGAHNLSGTRKGEALVARFGERGFDYAGNARIDLGVWRHARRAVVVNASAAVERAAGAVVPIDAVLPGARTSPLTWLRALRLHQWAKNLLVLVPLLTAHLLFEPAAVRQALLAFLAFGLCASSVYLLNDLVDLPADRGHPRKRLRPFAAGELPVLAGLALVPLLLAAAFTLAVLTLPPRFVLALAAYWLLTAAYTFALKRVEMVDVVVLAMLYTARIIAGTFALAVALSFWLLAFSMFLFLSLALVKRCAELEELVDDRSTLAPGRGYQPRDLASLRAMGMSSGFMAVLVLTLYIDSQNSQKLYAHADWLWAAAPVLLLWIMRIWLKTGRRELHGEDPLQFALKDPFSWVTLLVMGGIGFVATVGF